MRPILTSFLALHWAVVFALLAFVCIDGNQGVAAVLSTLGIAVDSVRHVQLGNIAVVAPLAVALLVVAVLFFWVFVESLVNAAAHQEGAESVEKTAFVAALAVLSLILVGGASQRIDGLFVVVALQLTALMISYLAMQAERRAAFAGAMSREAEIRATAHVMAQSAAHGSLLSRISGRRDHMDGFSRGDGH